MNKQDEKSLPEISVAPMMGWTDRHCRYFHRLLSPNAVLYTEMVTTGALLHGDAERYLRFDDKVEHPVVLQLGGSEPADLAVAAKMGAERGYDEINLNCGCPSDRVQNGAFGAVMMKDAELTARCVEAMSEAVDVPITVKCRIGVDDFDSLDFLDEFVSKAADKGCKTFIVHARKAWLKGLSPKENREIPELDYERVAAIKAKHPQLKIILNGGIKNTAQITENANKFDGFMIGREAYKNPFFLAEIERELFGGFALPERAEIIAQMADYASSQAEAHDTPVKSITRHILGLYQGLSGARAYKRTLSTLPYEEGSDARVILAAIERFAKAA